MRKKGKTRGWEVMLSYSFNTKMTNGFIKGTPSSDIVEAINHVKAAAAHAMHPLLLPVIIISHDLSSKNDQKQRDARDWLRRLEQAIAMQSRSSNRDTSMSQMEALNRDLVECHAQVLWKSPRAYMEIIEEFQTAMTRFRDGVREEESWDEETNEVHSSFLGRLDFYRQRLKGIVNFSSTTLERLNIQRTAVSSPLSLLLDIVALFCVLT